MASGYLNLVLHAHLPFVRHLDRDDRLEERWLFEAITETYIPLLQCFHQLLTDNIDFRITMSLSPTLMSMLADGLLQTRYKAHLDKLLRLADSEILRTVDDEAFHALALQYRQRFHEIMTFNNRYQGNLLTAFAELAQAGKVELITSAATHALLPYVQTDEALRAQIAMAVEVYAQHFGCRPRGIWLPECAYTPRVERYLREFGIGYFFVDTHGLTSAHPRPIFETFAPILTDSGIAVFARDEASSRQVWSNHEGYPGDFDYREYYRDIGYDLDKAYVGPYIHPDGIRVNTGIKYYRVTGDTQDKSVYDFKRAREKAEVHAGDFLFKRTQQVEDAHTQMGRKPVITAPYDAELFGHWWYEGPIFLDQLFRQMHDNSSAVKPITPSEYLQLYDDFQVCTLGMSTWGRDGFGDVWLNDSNDWIYRGLHDCERIMIEMAETCLTPSAQEQRALNQAVRELMLAQSSDWAFIMDAKTTVDYAVQRTKHHLQRFRTLATMIHEQRIDGDYLDAVEALDNLFPSADFALYRQHRNTLPSAEQPANDSGSRQLRVLMLSWEFPPMTVGGLARHVYDLSKHLVGAGCEVHLVTTAVGDYPLDEIVEGVHVHRVRVVQPDGGEFIHFAFQLNLQMLARCRSLMEECAGFDLVHAHDWLVAQVAVVLKRTYRLPLLSTIHATEHGRNSGIHTDVQRHIHHLEWELTYESRRVIVCSTAMQSEVNRVFSLPMDKIDVLPNGVDRKQLQRHPSTSVSRSWNKSTREPLVVFVGRLVQEKGAQLLLSAAPDVLSEFPGTRFLILGRGPFQETLMTQAEQLGISQQVEFAGFVSDEVRNQMLGDADVAVFPSLYEPFGIVVLEAMSIGTPVVVADIGGLTDIVQHDHNGLKMLPNDVLSLGHQVRRILGDNQLARRVAEVAAQELVRFDWTNIAKDTIGIYEQIAPRQPR